MYYPISALAKPIAEAIEKSLSLVSAAGVNGVAGLEVPHAHLHLVPIRTIGDLSFANAQLADQNTLSQMAQQITALL